MKKQLPRLFNVNEFWKQWSKLEKNPLRRFRRMEIRLTASMNEPYSKH